MRGRFRIITAGFIVRVPDSNRSYYLVKILMYSIYPLAWPIAKGLDLLLGTAAHTGPGSKRQMG